MNINNRVGLALSIVLLFASNVTAQPKPTTRPQPPTPSPTISTQQREELEKLQQEKEIRDRVQNEVDRAFSYTTAMLNILLVVLTLLPIFATFGVWLLYRSVISQVISETKKQLEEEVEKQLKTQVAEELKQQTEALLEQKNKELQEEINKLKTEFDSQVELHLKKLISDAQTAQTKIQRTVTELSQITPQPSPTQEPRSTETQQKIQQLTTEFQKLESNPLIRLTANDYLSQGNALFFENRYEEAIASYDKAIELKPDYYDAWNHRGVALGSLGRNEEAIASWDKAIEIKPNDHEVWYNRGVALRDLGRNEEAIASWDKTIEIKPDYYDAWYNQGVVLGKLKRYEEAIASYDEAIKIKTDYHNAWYNKARCYALTQNVDLAINNLQQAIKLHPAYKEKAKTDSDFDTIREDERFHKLIEG
ncbi:tetratricopeptide repeat protein [Nostoc sp. UHCC 0702]|nr:tetratricopeptide repeat protein [Nostoc sp. UHCC 0702]